MSKIIKAKGVNSLFVHKTQYIFIKTVANAVQDTYNCTSF